jgi:hypothetical protein
MIQRPESLCKDNWYGIDSMLELREEIDNPIIYIRALEKITSP